MKNLAKFASFVALCGAFVACGDDDGASSKEVSEIIDPSTVVKGTMTDERDGQEYGTVTIGDQTWMAENLNYAYNEPTATEDSSSFCYNNELDNCEKYGRLYLWSAAMDSAALFSTTCSGCGYRLVNTPDGNVRGVCPEGWHIPSRYEYEVLLNHIDNTVGFNNTAGVTSYNQAAGTTALIGGHLKAVSDLWTAPEVPTTAADDAYGFSALPAGSINGNGDFSGLGYYANFWSATQRNLDYPFALHLEYINDSFALMKDLENRALSVRCVKD